MGATSRVGRINLIAALCTVAAALIAASFGHRSSEVTVRAVEEAELGAQVVELSDGTRALIDASGAQIRLREYRRIASGSAVSDWLLMELCEPDRVLAVTALSATRAPWRHRFAGKRRIVALDNLERLLNMAPDLLVIDSFGDHRRVARLRDEELVVMDLGQMRGLRSLELTIARLGVLCGQRERARVLARRVRNLTSLASDIPDVRRPRAVYLSPYGDRFFGGTRGTGYHDLLRYAGLADAAAESYSDFPEFSAEQVLALDPDVVVTRSGMGALLCRHAGLATLRACGEPGAVIELPAFSIDDPGLGLIESIEALHELVYPPARE